MIAGVIPEICDMLNPCIVQHPSHEFRLLILGVPWSGMIIRGLK